MSFNFIFCQVLNKYIGFVRFYAFPYLLRTLRRLISVARMSNKPLGRIVRSNYTYANTLLYITYNCININTWLHMKGLQSELKWIRGVKIMRQTQTRTRGSDILVRCSDHWANVTRLARRLRSHIFLSLC